MDCNVILDLLPLYLDDCCSAESAELIESHLKNCKSCSKALENMKGKDFCEEVSISVPEKISRIEQFKASLIQSVSLFVSFALIILGVTFESVTPLGSLNGNWAYMLIVPATAFMVSLANWYFVRFYKNAKVFSWFSSLFNFMFSLCGFAWAVIHYGNFGENFLYPGIGAFVALVLCVASKILSSFYAKCMGKE